MNKKTIISISVASLFIAGAIGGTLYCAQQKLEKLETNLNQTLSKVNQNLPHGIKMEYKITEQSLFQTAFKINTTYEIQKKNITNSQTYKIEHGILSWFGDEFQITGESKISHNFGDSLKIKTTEPHIEKIQGTINQNGSFSLSSKISNLAVIINKNILDEKTEKTKDEKPTELIIEANNGFSKTSYSAETGKVTKETTFPTLNLKIQPESAFGISIEKITEYYSYNLKEANIGKVSYKIESLKDKTSTVELKKAELNAEIMKNKEKYDISTTFKIADLSVLTQKNSQIETSFSIKGVSNKIIDFYNEFQKNHDSKKQMTPEQTKKIDDLLVQAVKSGIKFSVDRIKLKNQNNLIDFSGYLEINPAVKERAFLISENSKIEATISAEGELAQIGNMTFSQILGKEQQGNNFKLNLKHETGTTKINGEDAPEEINESIVTFLNNLDVSLGLATESPKVSEKITENPTETKPEAVAKTEETPKQ